VAAEDTDLTAEHLDVYDTRAGPWNPDHGPIEIPDDWDFLPSGDAFVTRQVKAGGAYWNSWQPRDRNRRHHLLPVDEPWAGDEVSYREARRVAHEAVDTFLATHRAGD
jgi:hypothetical protein